MHTASATAPRLDTHAATRHSVLVRVTHWITTFSFVALLVSGIAILLAHPRLYWGETGSVGTPSLIDLPLPFMLTGQSGWGRYLHFQSAWAIVLCGLVYGIAGLLTRHFRGNYQLTYNALQRNTYLTVGFTILRGRCAGAVCRRPCRHGDPSGVPRPRGSYDHRPHSHASGAALSNLLSRRKPETLTFASHRILMSGHSMAREFDRGMISKTIPVNVLNLAGILPQAKCVVFHPFDTAFGFESLDLPDALHPQTLLTYGMNGQEIPTDHGAPVHLRVARQLGYKSVKYLARITVTDNLKGYSWYAGI